MHLDIEADETNIVMTNENNECAICLEQFEVGQKLSCSQMRICNHVYHEQCLYTWLMKNDCCPCCRVNFIDDKTILECDSDDESVTECCEMDESDQDSSSIQSEHEPSILVDSENADAPPSCMQDDRIEEEDHDLELGEFHQEQSPGGRKKRPTRRKGLNYLEVNADDENAGNNYL